jgi:hypothetical protein
VNKEQDVQRVPRSRYRRARSPWLAGLIACAGSGTVLAQGTPAASRFTDPEDGRFDVSSFLDTAYGFVPLLIPITEPAVGYGAVGAAFFIDGEPAEPGEPYVRPNIGALGALRTENGTRGWLAGHLGTWRDGRARTTAALTDLDVNLEFFGLGGDQVSDEGLDYSVKGQGGVLGGSYKIGASSIWLGARFLSIDTSVTFEQPLLPAFTADDGLRLGALTPTLTVDRRDNFFTPIRGWYLDLAVPLYREDFGSDRDFETANLTGLLYRPLRPALFFGLRGSVKDSSERTPFFLRPYVSLRGVQALEFQGESAAEIETELRWQIGSRYSVVGFAGVGEARVTTTQGESGESVTAGGAGFRYLVARRYGLHLGIDIAGGAGDTVLYVVFGNAWLRP